MAKFKVLKTHAGNYLELRKRNEVVEIPNKEAAGLLDKGFIEEVKVKKTKEEKASK